MVLDKFEANKVIYGFQESLLSMIIPRNLNSF